MFYSDVCRYKIVFRGSIVRSGNGFPRVNTKNSDAVIIFVKKHHDELVTELLCSEMFTRWLFGRETMFLTSPLPQFDYRS